jgi:hypothetical protein
VKSGNLLVLILALSIGATACASGSSGDVPGVEQSIGVVEDPVAPDGDETVSGGFAVDGGLSVQEALDYTGSETIAVQGYVVITGPTGSLCETLAESFPPQCGGQSLIITNPGAASGEVLVEEGETQWSEQPVTFFGSVSNGQFTIDTTISG